MNVELSGVITTIFPTEKYGALTKRVFWLRQINVQYPCNWSLEFWHDDVDVLNKYKSGDAVTCQVEVRGNYWSKNGRDGIINVLKCFGINKF
jgi:hypothetical protein